MIDLTLVKFLACLKELIIHVIAQPVVTIVKCVLPVIIAQLTGPRSLRWFAFYFYLLGMMFLLLDSYADVTKLPPARSAYSVCHYYQVYLPEEAMALQTRDRGMSYLSGNVVKHHQKNVVHFIVAK